MQIADDVYLKREGAFVFVFAGLISFATAHFVHDAWQLTEFFRISVGAPKPLPHQYAPTAYRVLMPAVQHGISRLFPGLDFSWVNAVTDLVLLWATLWALYRLAVYGISSAAKQRTVRTLRIALTFLLAVSALAWMTQYQRAETAPTALYLAVCALTLRRQTAWAIAVQLAWTVLQGFTRADVGLFVGIAMVITGLVKLPAQSEGRRRWVLQGIATAAIAVLIQAYLQFVRYPHRTYDPQTPVVQLPNNLLFHMWSNALIAILPVWLPILYALGRRYRLFEDRVQAMAVIAGAIYFPLWFTVGSLAEVRIYIPFLLLMSPVAARAIALSLGTDEPQGSPDLLVEGRQTL